MKKRTPQQVGEILRQRREQLFLSQDDLDGVSSATVGKAERAVQTSFKPRTMAAYMRALGLVPGAYGRLLAGEDLAGLVDDTVGEVQWSAHEGPSALDRLRGVDPEMWADMNRIAERRLRS